MLPILYRPVQLIILSALSLLQVSPVYAFYSTVMIQSLLLHFSMPLSFTLCLMGAVISPRYAISLIGLWTLSYFLRAQLYVTYERPLTIVVMSLVAFAGFLFCTQPFDPVQTITQSSLVFLFTINGGLAWISRYQGLATLRKSRRSFCTYSLCAIALLILPVPYALVALFTLFCFQAYSPLASAFEENTLLMIFSLKIFMLSHRELPLLSMALILYSVSAAYKGLHYDSQQTSPALKRTDSGVKRHYRALSLGKKLSSSRL